MSSSSSSPIGFDRMADFMPTEYMIFQADVTVGLDVSQHGERAYGGMLR